MSSTHSPSTTTHRNAAEAHGTASAETREVVVFKGAPGVPRAQVLEALRLAQTWLSAQPGYLSRELLEDAEHQVWIDQVRWRSLADARRAAAEIERSPCFPAMMAALDPQSIQMLHATAVSLE